MRDTMSQGPLVSVVMPAYKVGAFIGDALASIAGQTYTNWEILVVDDKGPDDGMVAIVRRFAAEHPTHRVELIEHEVNKGVSAARNTGIAASIGELVAFLDPDDHWFADHLERATAQFERSPGLDVTTGPVEVLDVGPVAKPTWVTARGEWHRTYFPHTLAIYNFIQPSATVVRRSAVQQVGGFDTDPQIQHIEDYDLWIRMIDAGMRFVFLEKPTSLYRRHAAGATADRLRMRELDEYLFRKHAGFMRRSTTVLHQRMLGELDRTARDLADLQRSTSGPLFRLFKAIDRALRGVWRAVRRVGRG